VGSTRKDAADFGLLLARFTSVGALQALHIEKLPFRGCAPGRFLAGVVVEKAEPALDRATRTLHDVGNPQAASKREQQAPMEFVRSHIGIHKKKFSRASIQ
jgi:hypothetical protein